MLIITAHGLGAANKSFNDMQEYFSDKDIKFWSEDLFGLGSNYSGGQINSYKF
jgi:hypothetical protein